MEHAPHLWYPTSHCTSPGGNVRGVVPPCAHEPPWIHPANYFRQLIDGEKKDSSRGCPFNPLNNLNSVTLQLDSANVPQTALSLVFHL